MAARPSPRLLREHRSTRPPRAPAAGVVLALALLVAACGTDGESARTATNQPGSPAPAWSGTTLDGEEVALADLEGDVVMLNIWATWCAPCVREMPKLDALHRAHADEGLRVVGASVDRGGAAEQVRRFVREHDLDFQILLDPNQRVMTRFRTFGVPETFLIGHDGTILHRWIGEFDPMAPDDRARVVAALEARAEDRGQEETGP